MKNLKYFMELLGLKKLSQNSLKKAYRDNARTYHPDNKETGNAEKFMEIQTAYNVLQKEIRQKIIIKVNLTDVINGKSFTYDNIKLTLNPSTIKTFINPIRTGNKEIIVQFQNNDGFRLTKNKNKFIIHKTVYITFNDIVNGNYILNVGEKKYGFKVPNKGNLSCIRKFSENVYLRLNYIIKKEGAE